MVGEDLFRNDLYLTLVWHPARHPARKIASLLTRLKTARATGFELDRQALKHLVARDDRRLSRLGALRAAHFIDL